MAQSAYSVDFSPIAAVGNQMQDSARDMREAAYTDQKMVNMKQQNESGAIDLAQKKLQASKATEEDARMNKPMPLETFIAGYSKGAPKTAEDVSAMMHSMGLADVVGKDQSGKPMSVTTEAKQDTFKKYMQKNPEQFQSLLAKGYSEVSDNINAIQAKTEGGKKQLKPEEQKQLQQLTTAKMALAEQLGKLGNHMKVQEGLESAKKALGLDDAGINSYAKNNPEINASFQMAIKTGDMAEFNKLLTEKVKADAQAKKEAGKEKSAMDREKVKANAKISAARMVESGRMNRAGSSKAIREYNYAVDNDGYEGTFDEWVTKHAPGSGRGKPQLPGITPAGTSPAKGTSSLTNKYLNLK